MQLPDLKMPDKEKKILEAAITVISEKGFNASTTSEIAQMAGVAEGTIFRYFKTKRDILQGILIHLVNIVGEPLILESFKKILLNSDQKDLRSIIKALLKERFTLMESLYPMLRIIVTEAMYHEDIREVLYKKIISKALEIFKLFQEEMIAKGLMNKDIDPLAASRSIYGNLVGFFIYRKFFGPVIKLEDFDKDLDRVVDIIMYGIAVRQN
jgi:AcrR family transcriptional regulator